jgi:hypothetical protein
MPPPPVLDSPPPTVSLPLNSPPPPSPLANVRGFHTYTIPPNHRAPTRIGCDARCVQPFQKLVAFVLAPQSRVSPPLPLFLSPRHEPGPLQPLSPAAALPRPSDIKVTSHRAQDQETFSKIDQYDTAPITKPPQAQNSHDTSDNSNNSLLFSHPSNS